MPAVSRETLDHLAAEYRLPAEAPAQLSQLLEALAAEPDPHTTVSDPARALDVHIRDSLSALEIPAVRAATRLLDIGAGAGFPGLPLAVALPGARIDMLDSSGRKTAVTERLIAAAGLANARAIHARVEDWARHADHRGYDVVTARAVARLAVLAEYAAPLLALGGTLVAWKGDPDPSEVSAGERAAAELGLEPLGRVPTTPFHGARRLHLYLYSKVGDTPAKYPRKAGIAEKRPLGAKNGPEPPST